MAKKLAQKEKDELVAKLKESLGELEDDDRATIVDALSPLKPWKKGDSDRRKNDRRKPGEKKGPFDWLK